MHKQLRVLAVGLMLAACDGGDGGAGSGADAEANPDVSSTVDLGGSDDAGGGEPDGPPSADATTDGAAVPDGAPPPDAAADADAAATLDAAVAVPDGASLPPDAGLEPRDATPPGPDACEPALERCNGADDDCDGATDEGIAGLGEPCSSGTGACEVGGLLRCDAAGGLTCDARANPPAAETCDGRDEDCDGLLDEATDEPCYGGPAGTAGVGRCAVGVTSCVQGIRGDCAGDVVPVEEACDAPEDEDCDGRVDEGCECAPGSTRPCGLDAGACAPGTEVCGADGRFGPCEGGVEPGVEQCGGADVDCDGRVDEDTTVPCWEGPADARGVGTCRDGQRVCDGAALGPCEGQRLPLDADACGDGDTDCDGRVDEDSPAVETRCGVGVCAAVGQRVCVMGALVDGCRPGPERGDDSACDGLDDDCDGEIDEAASPRAVMCGRGACQRAGQETCRDGRLTIDCQPGSPAADDASCDGVDDDCDGQLDEDAAGAPTTCGIGGCARAGVTTCVAGRAGDTCRPGQPARNDAVCDGQDNDCNGEVDEDHQPVATQCGLGACGARGTRRCVQGVEVDDCAPGQPRAEVCGGVDDDCDGFVDNGCAYTRGEIQALVNQRCAGCHTGGGRSGNLNMDNFYVATVNVPAVQLPLLPRITPGSRDLSYLFHKISGTQAQVGGAGLRMPRNGPPFLDPREIERFGLWIDAGAPQ